MPPLDIGALRHRLVLELPAETPDLAGGVARSWAAAATLWAAIQPLDAQAGEVADAPATLATHRITLRWRQDLTAAARLRQGERIYRILSVTDPDERRQSVRVIAKTQDP